MSPQELLKRLQAEGTSPSLKLRLDGAPPSPETLELVKAHKSDLLRALAEPQGVPRLPWQLERLVSAACSDALPKGMTALVSGNVPDLAAYVLACASSYLVGTSDRNTALTKLWAAHQAWQREIN